MIYTIYLLKHEAYYQKRRNALSATDNVEACEHYSSERTAKQQAAKLRAWPYNLGPNEIHRYYMRRISARNKTGGK